MVLSGTTTHCLRSLAPDILTHEPEFWLVLLRRWRKGGDEPALGAFVEVGFIPQCRSSRQESGAPVQERIINFLAIIREIKERGRTLCVEAWWCGCEDVSCHLSFDLWINFKFQLRPGVYFLALGLSL